MGEQETRTDLTSANFAQVPGGRQVRSGSVSELEGQLAVQDHDNFPSVLSQAVEETRAAATAQRAQTPQARLLWLERALTELGLATDCLAPAKRLVEAERRLGAQQFERTQQALAAREAALAKLLADPDANLDVACQAYVAESPWLDSQPGVYSPTGLREPAGLELISAARRAIEEQLGGQITAAGPLLWPLVKTKAFQVLEELKQLSPIPPRLWSLRDAASELSRLPARRASGGF